MLRGITTTKSLFSLGFGYIPHLYTCRSSSAGGRRTFVTFVRLRGHEMCIYRMDYTQNANPSRTHFKLDLILMTMQRQRARIQAADGDDDAVRVRIPTETWSNFVLASTTVPLLFLVSHIHITRRRKNDWFKKYVEFKFESTLFVFKNTISQYPTYWLQKRALFRYNEHHTADTTFSSSWRFNLLPCIASIYSRRMSWKS